MNKETIKSLKMFGRTIIISALPVIIFGLQNGQPIKAIGLGVLIAVLMGANTYVNASDEFTSKGILPLV